MEERVQEFWINEFDKQIGQKLPQLNLMMKNYDCPGQMGTGQALKYICGKLNMYPFVTELLLCGQGIDDEGVRLLIEMLKYNMSIKEVNLESIDRTFANYISDEGARKFLDFPTNTPLNSVKFFLGVSKSMQNDIIFHFQNKIQSINEQNLKICEKKVIKPNYEERKFVDEAKLEKEKELEKKKAIILEKKNFKPKFSKEDFKFEFDLLDDILNENNNFPTSPKPSNSNSILNQLQKSQEFEDSQKQQILQKCIKMKSILDRKLKFLEEEKKDFEEMRNQASNIIESLANAHMETQKEKEILSANLSPKSPKSPKKLALSPKSPKSPKSNSESFKQNNSREIFQKVNSAFKELEFRFQDTFD